jgi:hypothetical protein
MPRAPIPLSPHSLRRELSARNLARSAAHLHDLSYGPIPSVLYAAEHGAHGNFRPASYRRILAHPQWNARLHKAYTADEWIPRAHDRRRSQLDCAASSDALLMNVFCYPGLLRRPAIRTLLGIDSGARPEFGVRANIPMRNSEVDRTELDMRLGSLLVEAKLTETTFGRASQNRLLRYHGVEETFHLDSLRTGASGFSGYQLVRGVLAAQHHNARFLLLCDGRRTDLHNAWLHVLGAVRSYDLRSRMCLLTWQELAAATPATVQNFLALKYGILVR